MEDESNHFGGAQKSIVYVGTAINGLSHNQRKQGSNIWALVIYSADRA